MSEPNEIPQDIWGKTYEWAAVFNADPFMTVGDIVARAIMAEREECAKIAEERDEDGAIWPDGYEIARFIRERNG